MIVLGIHAGHESGMALIKHGEILFAASEERFSRNKMTVSMPFMSVKEGLAFTGITPDQIDLIAVSLLNKNHPINGSGNFYHKLISFTNGKSLLKFYFPSGNKRIVKAGLLYAPLNILFALGLPRYVYYYIYQLRLLIKQLPGFKGHLEFFDHHDCHVATALLTSTFELPALSIVSEGTDGIACFKIDYIEKNKITRLCTSEFPHSPGHFYELSAEILGFNPVLHCGKITGLAAYGDPAVLYPEICRLMWVSNWDIRVSPLVYTLGVDYARTHTLPSFFKGESKENIAAAFQKRLEECILQIIKDVHNKYPVDTIFFTGGTAANVRLNQQIHNLTKAKNIYIHPGMSDCGQPLGAALLGVNDHAFVTGRRMRLKNAFLGNCYTNDEVLLAIQKMGIRHYRKSVNIADEIVNLIIKHEVVARFTGRMEYGPRALGNRSILFHAGDPKVNNWLNHKLHRSEFMPFAPAVLAEHADTLFHDIKGKEYTAEFMTTTCSCTDWMKENCPAVVHLDGSARPQLVYKDRNPAFYNILNKYYARTGIPVLINTSFNIHNEPIVCTPEDALRAFIDGYLPYLAIEDFLVYRH